MKALHEFKTLRKTKVETESRVTIKFKSVEGTSGEEYIVAEH